MYIPVILPAHVSRHINLSLLVSPVPRCFPVARNTTFVGERGWAVGGEHGENHYPSTLDAGICLQTEPVFKERNRMKTRMVLFGIALLAAMTLFSPCRSFAAAEGDLMVMLIPENSFFGVAPGDSIYYDAIYMWTGANSATNVSLTFQPSPSVTVVSVSVPPSSQSSDLLTWNLGTLEMYAYDTIKITAVVKAGVAEGTEISCPLKITGNVSDTDLTNNTADYPVKVVAKGPDLFVWKMGSMEFTFDEEGFFFAGEQGQTQEFTLMYWNMGLGSAPDVVLTDTLPEGFTFVSAEPSPTRTEGQQLIWSLGNLKTWDYGEIKVRAIPTQTGLYTNHAAISTTATEAALSGNSLMPNESDYQIKIIDLFPPVVTSPSTSTSSGSFVVTPNPKFEGLAKVGATVTMYEGPADHWGNDITDLTPLGTAVAGNDRSWTIQPTQLTETKDYYLYFRAEKDGKISSLSQVVIVSVNAALAEAGFDMGGFSIETGDNTSNPGGLGGTTGGVPGEEITITLRETAPDDIETNKNLWGYYNLEVTVDDHGDTNVTSVPFTSVTPVENPNGSGYRKCDFKYLLENFGPGAKVWVRFTPVAYDDSTHTPYYVTDEKITITEILIDPAGYVYDIDTAGREYEWPEVPPEDSLIDTATVTALERTGDTDWTVWDAAAHGDQVNPQVTDTTTEDKVKQKGYFAFFVPSGQYRVSSSAQNYADLESPILTVINEPIYYNMGMRRSKQIETGVADTGALVELPKMFTLLRNYPNPFNPTTTIAYLLPAKGFTTLSIYNMQGQKVRELLSQEMPAGLHTVTWDGRDSSGRPVSSGAYFSSLSSGRVHAAGKMLLIK